MVISINKHDHYCYIVFPIQHLIRLYTLVRENGSLVNSVNVVNYVKGFAQAQGHYQCLTLKERNGSCSLNFHSLVEAGFRSR